MSDAPKTVEAPKEATPVVEAAAPAAEPAPAVAETAAPAEAAATDAAPATTEAAAESETPAAAATEETKKEEVVPIEEGFLESKGTKFPQYVPQRYQVDCLVWTESHTNHIHHAGTSSIPRGFSGSGPTPSSPRFWRRLSSRRSRPRLPTMLLRGPVRPVPAFSSTSRRAPTRLRRLVPSNW